MPCSSFSCFTFRTRYNLSVRSARLHPRSTSQTFATNSNVAVNQVKDLVSLELSLFDSIMRRSCPCHITSRNCPSGISSSDLFERTSTNGPTFAFFTSSAGLPKHFFGLHFLQSVALKCTAHSFAHHSSHLTVRSSRAYVAKTVRSPCLLALPHSSASLVDHGIFVVSADKSTCTIDWCVTSM